MNYTIILFSLGSLLLNSSSDATNIITDTHANANLNTNTNGDPHPDPQGPNNKQSVVSTCHAVRAIMGHDGEIAQWKAKCRIEVWTDKDQPELKDLSSEEKAKVMTELGNNQPTTSTQQPPNYNQEMFEKSRYLAEEAANRHYLCMEAKRSILYQLKLLLPAGLTSCEKITQVMNDLKLTSELEAFINQVNGPMKDLVAKIHSIEQNTTLTEIVKMEAIRAAKTELTALLDENCKDDHPSIRYHDVSYLPHPDLDKVKMTLAVSHPGKPVTFFNLPEESYGPHIQNLRQITEAALHHGQETGQQGLFECLNQPINRFNSGIGEVSGPESGLNTTPFDSSVTSFTRLPSGLDSDSTPIAQPAPAHHPDIAQSAVAHSANPVEHHVEVPPVPQVPLEVSSQANVDTTQPPAQSSESQNVQTVSPEPVIAQESKVNSKNVYSDALNKKIREVAEDLGSLGKKL